MTETVREAWKRESKHLDRSMVRDRYHGVALMGDFVAVEYAMIQFVACHWRDDTGLITSWFNVMHGEDINDAVCLTESYELIDW